MIEQKYEIGTKFNHYALKSIHTIVDVHKTYNSAGNLISWTYIVENELMGQKLTGTISQTTIDRSTIIESDCCCGSCFYLDFNMTQETSIGICDYLDAARKSNDYEICSNYTKRKQHENIYHRSGRWHFIESRILAISRVAF